MNNYKKIIYVLGISAAVCLMSGCSADDVKDRIVSKIDNDQQEQAPEATPTPTPVPTATPVPTSTPAPRRIGTKTPQSNYVYITNGLPEALREFYLRGSDTEDWGKNLIPVESTVKAAEKVQMCYTPSTTSGGLYDIKVVDKKGNTYAIYEVNLGDFEDGTIRLEDGEVYLSYISLTTGDETRADYSSTLAEDYEGSTGSYSYQDDHEGDYDYGYYDDYGNWITYDFSNYSDDTYYDNSYDYNDYSDDYGYYDDYGNYITYY